MSDREHWLKVFTSSFSEILTNLNSLYLFQDNVKEAGLSQEFKDLYATNRDKMTKLAIELTNLYEKETGQYVDCMEGWGFRSEWDRELKGIDR